MTTFQHCDIDVLARESCLIPKKYMLVKTCYMQLDCTECQLLKTIIGNLGSMKPLVIQLDSQVVHQR
jgi:hypothetical protein